MLGYNSDEMGELEDDDDALQGSHALDQYDSLMSDFLAEHATQDHAHEGGLHYDVPRQHGTAADPDEAEAAIAIAKVSLLRALAMWSLWNAERLVCG